MMAQDTATYHVNKAFLGIGGVDPKVSLTEYNLVDSEIIRTAMSSAQQNIILDSSKLERVTFCKIGEITDADYIIKDEDVSPDLVEEISRLGINVVIAKYK